MTGTEPFKTHVGLVVTDGVAKAFARLAKLAHRDPGAFIAENTSTDPLGDLTNAIAAQLEARTSMQARLQATLEATNASIEGKVSEISETLIRIAGGNFAARASRTNAGDLLDVLAYMVNSTAVELELLFAERERDRNRQRAVLESMVDGVLLVDAAHQILQANQAVARILGISAEELIGCPVVGLVAKEDLGRLQQALAVLTSATPLRDFEMVMSASSGRLIPLVVNASVYDDRKGIVLVLRDQLELRDARAQLHIADRMAVIGTVTAGAAHEINNPLMYVQANVEFVLGELNDNAHVPPATISALDEALSGARRIRDIVRQLKVFSRSDDEKTLKYVDVNVLLDATLELLHNELRHRARVVRSYGPVSPILASESRLGQVFMNLIHNAVHAIPDGNVDLNQVTLATHMEGDRVVIRVSDTGCGIPPETLPRIFDAFFTTKPTGIGAGLGLSVCQKVVSVAGGSIRVESETGRGSTFEVVLPGCAPVVETAAPKERGEKATPKHPSVLIVDDEASIGEGLRRLLSRSYDVAAVVDGAAALEVLSRTTYDVVLCDMMMPRMSGMALYRRVLESTPKQAQRFIFMTGGTFTAESREFLDKVEQPLLEKPFRRSDVLALIDEILARCA